MCAPGHSPSPQEGDNWDEAFAITAMGFFLVGVLGFVIWIIFIGFGWLGLTVALGVLTLGFEICKRIKASLDNEEGSDR